MSSTLAITTLRPAGLTVTGTRRVKQMRKLCELVPNEVLDNLPPLTVFAPSSALLGHVLTFGTGEAASYISAHDWNGSPKGS